MPKPVVSVVVPTFNRARMLRDCVQSLLNQDLDDDEYEIIVVDDGSTDSTAMVIGALCEDAHSGLRYLPCSHAGLNAARNAGISLARADLICFVDDDIDAPPGWLRALTLGAERNPSAGCLGGPIRLRLEGKPPRSCGERIGETELDLGQTPQLVKFVWGANMAVRRGALAVVGKFNELMPLFGDEIEWQERLRKRGGQIAYVPDAWLWHRRAAGDLRFTRLLRVRFVRGRNRALYLSVMGHGGSVLRELNSAARAFAHAVLRGCSVGVLRASLHVGVAWGLVRLNAATVDPTSAFAETKPPA